jgi:RNA polymerase sigma-70 factor (ECF subfamily)
MNDSQLVLLLKSDDKKVFNHIFKQHYKPLLAYVVTFTGNKNRAKDIVQNSFIILWNKRKTLSDDSTLKSYLFTVAHNLYITQYRKKATQIKFFDELKYNALNERVTEDDTIAKERINKLLDLIDELPPKCKEILLLNKQEGLKYAEISETLNISIKTVESQMRIAFKKIRLGFKKDELYLFMAFKDSLHNLFRI